MLESANTDGVEVCWQIPDFLKVEEATDELAVFAAHF